MSYEKFKQRLLNKRLREAEEKYAALIHEQSKPVNRCSRIIMLNEKTKEPDAIDRGTVCLQEIPEQSDKIRFFWSIFDGKGFKNLAVGKKAFTDDFPDFFDRIAAAGEVSTEQDLCQKITSVTHYIPENIDAITASRQREVEESKKVISEYVDYIKARNAEEEGMGFRCPVHYEIFLDPVLLETGITVDRDIYQSLMAKSEDERVCPFSRIPLTQEPFPNSELKKQINAYLEKWPDRKYEQRKPRVNIQNFEQFAQSKGYATNARLLAHRAWNNLKIAHPDFNGGESDDILYLLSTVNKDGWTVVPCIARDPTVSTQILRDLMQSLSKINSMSWSSEEGNNAAGVLSVLQHQGPDGWNTGLLLMTRNPTDPAVMTDYLKLLTSLSDAHAAGVLTLLQQQTRTGCCLANFITSQQSMPEVIDVYFGLLDKLTINLSVDACALLIPASQSHRVRPCAEVGTTLVSQRAITTPLVTPPVATGKGSCQIM